MDFRLLGPLAAVENDRPLALGGRKQRSLLAVLLLHANDVVPAEVLIDELWGEAPPATVAKSVQVYVSRLRKELGPDRLVTRAPGYLLRLEESELDVARFERLLTDARACEPPAAADRLREALALWQGPPLADLAYEPFAQAEIARLEELRLTAVEERIDADLALGRHAELSGELDALIVEHPLRERLRGQQMLALYRSGRQAEALEVYRRTRTALIDQLGIEPGPALRSLEQAILAQDASLELRAPSSRPAAHTSTGFVGRRRELAQLDEALRDALEGRGRLVLLAGEPGIGKSRLSEELLDRARAAGALVLIGRCWEAGGAPAYWPWVQALRTCIRSVEPSVLRTQLGAGAPDLAQLLPELAELFPDLDRPSAPESDGARFRLFEAVSGFLGRVTDARPTVLVLDDLHAADEPSLLLLRFMGREVSGRRLLGVCAFRDVDPTLGVALSATLAELVREPQTTRLELGGLSAQDVAAYIVHSTGIEPAEGLAAAIHAETEGNPLFVGEVVRLLDDEGRIADAEARLRIPPGVRVVIGQRIQRLSEPCRDVLAAASVMGREFDLEVLAAIGGSPPDELLDVLDEAVGERILVDVPGSPGRLRFGHALIRDTLYDELSPARRAGLHQRAGEAIEAIHAAGLDAHLSDLARHYYAAASRGHAAKAIEYATRAGDHAVTRLAFEEAVRQYELALTLVTDTGARCELLLALGDAHARAGDRAASKHTFEQAGDLALAGGLPDYAARAALGYGGRIAWDVSRDDDRLVVLLERALAGLDTADSPLRVRLLSRLAGGPLRDTRFASERGVDLSDEALAMARRIGDPATLAYAIHGNITAHLSPAHVHACLALATELVSIVARVDDPERLLDAHSERAEALLELGDGDAARRELEAMAAAARKLRQPSQDWFVSAMRARQALLEGRFGDAEQLIDAARQVGERAQSWNAEVTYRLQLYVLRREQGRLGEIRDLVRRSPADYPTYPIFRCVLGHTAAVLGDTDTARAVLTALGADDLAALPFDEEWLVSLSMLAEITARLGDATVARELYLRLAPFEDLVAKAPQELSTGAVARYLGLLAATGGREQAAERHFEQALELNARLGARSWVAHTQVDYARLLRAQGTAPAADHARRLLAEADRAYAELGIPAAAGGAT